jgi:hypothetical protein
VVFRGYLIPYVVVGVLRHQPHTLRVHCFNWRRTWQRRTSVSWMIPKIMDTQEVSLGWLGQSKKSEDVICSWDVNGEVWRFKEGRWSSSRLLQTLTGIGGQCQLTRHSEATSDHSSAFLLGLEACANGTLSFKAPRPHQHYLAFSGGSQLPVSSLVIWSDSGIITSQGSQGPRLCQNGS